MSSDETRVQSMLIVSKPSVVASEVESLHFTSSVHVFDWLVLAAECVVVNGRLGLITAGGLVT